ncbi:ubiquitin activation protein [Nocardia panacis]|uniref:Ubiquitin activation protein n=1 Tax=Nocardia panacis TaxID=2340916 RepID=A0A3A4KJT6_9NOCA|nr:ThiF family adenylyltransferase [Nocardia panacis]RJO75182.1 ubiquitin activation protein [Nocardia panacis]
MRTFGPRRPSAANTASDRIGRWHLSALRVPPEPGADTEILAEIRQWRARVIFDHGRRPEFRTADGRHLDDEELDYGAWHFLARADADGPVLGYVRLATPLTPSAFHSREHLGDTAYERFLDSQGVDGTVVFEHSRVLVEHSARNLGLGTVLSAAAIGAAYHLGARLMVGTSGTEDDQDKFHARFGFREVHGTRRYIPRYTGEVVLLVHRPGESSEYSGLIAEMRDRFPELAAQRPESTLPHQIPPGLRSSAAPDRETWQPVLLDMRRSDDVAALLDLLDSGRVREAHDTITAQLADLIGCRDPEHRCGGAELEARIADHTAGTPLWRYGTWVWYPWSGRLVHVLPRTEFRLVRTDRNRDKIERSRQRELLCGRIGIVGLSVGSSAALTLALEGVGGAFRLADHDELALTNLNRLRCGVHELGVPKAVACARQMFEIDPYLDIEIFPAGIDDTNMDTFLAGPTGRLDVLIEECDSLPIKLAVREHARAHRIPVLMDTSDRGLLDIERFDLEPDRPLLHGLLDQLSSERVAAMNPADRLQVVLRIVGGKDSLSPALAASFDQLGHTLTSWPQLAADVALGGALITDTTRRILLGQQCASGRYYVDFAQLLAPDRAVRT